MVYEVSQAHAVRNIHHSPPVVLGQSSTLCAPKHRQLMRVMQAYGLTQSEQGFVHIMDTVPSASLFIFSSHVFSDVVVDFAAVVSSMGRALFGLADCLGCPVFADLLDGRAHLVHAPH